MHQPLESARLKIRRAKDHVAALDKAVKRFRDTDPYHVTRDLERDGAEHVYRVKVLRQPPAYLGAIVGDFFHNIRSALDSIVYDLSITTKPTLADKRLRNTGFPISDSPKHFGHKAIRFVPVLARAEIESAQPYKREVSSFELNLDPLWTVQEFNRLDKHRYVHVVPALAMGGFWKEPSFPVQESHRPLGPLKGSAEVARFVFSEPHPEVDVQFRPMFDVTLPNRVLPARVDLLEIASHVEDEVLPRFTQFFP